MSNTIRIRTIPNGGDNYLKLKVEQDFDFIEILSLKISQEDVYRKFCSDYGAIVGRVIINNGFGVPNAKVSVFIPIDDIDKQDTLISGLYPFELITDKDNEGVRYNLLPKENDSSNICYTTVGTFPTKREVLDNESTLNIYCKYYKFTTTTNYAGDFMIFGVPVGTYTVHMDADISDIGIASQRPYDLISQGAPAKLFQSPTKFNGDKNLDKLPQIKTLNVGVNVQPFWGDTENCEIGITRLDLNLNHSIIPSAIFMGSIFGDQHKHSVNKNCLPRKKVGNICEQMTGPGSIKMIRKTIDGQIENYDIEGGRVIDDDGTWAYQIPMNLDYMVTDEMGNMILSQDPNKGIPTRASLRFNIGLDESGNEGRVRTRARYLVPNNPKTINEIDYEFGSNTKDSSFRDMYWNKIYSVSNFISRFERDDTGIGGFDPIKTRNFVGIKEVDSCVGDKTPFPYNRASGEGSPIFFVICIIIEIIVKIVALMNFTIIPLINLIISALMLFINSVCSIVNGLIDFINSLSNLLGGGNIGHVICPNINPVPCITIACENNRYAPGCFSSSNGWAAAGLSSNDYFPQTTSQFLDAVGLDDCISIQMADSLDLYKLDFYNDWVNGVLYSFLLKYKKTKSNEKFCDYNGNYHIMLSDACVPQASSPVSSITTDCQNKGNFTLINEGLIKKVGGEFFYAATTNNVNYKMYATDLISLGSVFDCDWQGIPKIQQYLIPTTYKIPPINQELSPNGSLETSGLAQNGNNSTYLFFKVNCLGLHVDDKGCLNARHICELGVDIDEEQVINGVITKPDGVIGLTDIDSYRGMWVRNVFSALNESSNFTIPPSTYFNNQDNKIYDYISTTYNDLAYTNFRKYSAGQNVYSTAPTQTYIQPNNSYFFYFGLLPGKTALDKMNQKFFTTCNIALKNKLLIQATTTVAITVHKISTGSITFKFIGGTGPYTYTVNGVAPLSFNAVNGITVGPVTISNLSAGSYIIDGVDLLGTQVSQTIIVSPPSPLYAMVSVTKNASTNTSSDGEITISSVGGGIGPYTYQLKSFGGASLIPAGTPLSAPITIPVGLAVDSTNGYRVIVTDSALEIIAINNLLVYGPSPLQIKLNNSVDVMCYGGNDGSINLYGVGGTAPYSFSTTGPSGFYSLSPNMSGLVVGAYVTNVIDALSRTATLTTLIGIQNPQMIVQSATKAQIAKQNNPSQYDIPFYVTGGAGAGNVTVQYDIDNSNIWTDIQKPYVNSTTLIYLSITANKITNNIKIRFRNTADTCYSNYITIPKSAMTLPSLPLTCTINRTGMAVYTYTVTGIGGIAPYTGTGIIHSSNPHLYVTITDSVGNTASAVY